MTERERSQLVVSLGEGDDGQALRKALDEAAARVGKPVSTWAREVLQAQVGGGNSDPIADVYLDGNKLTTVDLSAVPAMQRAMAGRVEAFVFGKWQGLTVTDPDELFGRWKRVKRMR
jgi:hypothetical protein